MFLHPLTVKPSMSNPWQSKLDKQDAAPAMFRVVKTQVREFFFIEISAIALIEHRGLQIQREIKASNKQHLRQLIQETQAKWDAEWAALCSTKTPWGQAQTPFETAAQGYQPPLGSQPPRLAQALPATGTLPPLPGVMLARVNLAGTGFYLQAADCPLLPVGTKLDLLPEPDNQHDEFAVAVLYQSIMLGYVPRDENKAISRLLQAGKSLHCRLSNIAPDQAPWHMYDVEIYQLD